MKKLLIACICFMLVGCGSKDKPIENEAIEPTQNPQQEVKEADDKMIEPTVEPTEEPQLEISHDEFLDSLISPVSNPEITCGTGCYAGHEEVDVHDCQNPNGDVFAAQSGTVQEVGQSKEKGNYIIISHSNHYTTQYSHLSEISVKKGAEVEQGDIIGVIGMTGYSTGEHLGFKVLENGVYVPCDRIFES